MKLAIEANGVYRPLWETKKRYVILMGGRGAGRSYETSQKIAAGLVQIKVTFRAAIMRAVHQDIAPDGLAERAPNVLHFPSR
jgi:phage terminase large subunit